MKSKNRNKQLSVSRRRAVHSGLLFIAVGVPGAAKALGAANRNAARGRRNIARRQVSIRVRAASAKQRGEALAAAKKAQASLKKKWVTTPAAKNYAKANGLPSSGFKSASALKAAPVSMATVVRDMKASPIQAVKVSPTPGSELRGAVMPIDLRTGGLSGNNVVEMARVPRAGASVSNQVRAAVQEATIEGNPGAFTRTDIVVAKL